MRYVVISFPFIAGTSAWTDFRILALAIAFCRRLLYSEVCIFDNDEQEYIAVYRKQKKSEKRPASAPFSQGQRCMKNAGA